MENSRPLEAEISACLRAEYRLKVAQLEPLPIGADYNSALYRATSSDGTAYFVKLRRGDFNAMTLVVPQFLHEQGCQAIIAPCLTHSQQLWCTLPLHTLSRYTLTLFPYVAGDNGYAVTLSPEQWRELGGALKQIHTANVPAEWQAQIAHERYSAHWREQVIDFQAQAESTHFSDPISVQLAALLRRQRPLIDALVERAAHFAAILQREAAGAPQDHVLCHGDLHAGNVLLASDGRLYIVDWDTLIFAPKERDLMAIGGAFFANHRSPQEEGALFYQGYGPALLDPIALAYYRCERIVEDIVAYCQEILFGEKGDADSRQGLAQLAAQFLPNGVVEIALRSVSAAIG